MSTGKAPKRTETTQLNEDTKRVKPAVAMPSTAFTGDRLAKSMAKRQESRASEAKREATSVKKVGTELAKPGKTLDQLSSSSTTIKGKSSGAPDNHRKSGKDEAKSIDDLFTEAVSKKRQLAEQAKVKQEKEEEAIRRDKAAAEEEKRTAAMVTDSNPKIHRWDKETGLPVYKYYDLRMGEAGSGYTPLCPFDCSCCF